jgi:polyhydroxyalkanoate synthase
VGAQGRDPAGVAAAGWRLYEQLDEARRIQGRILDALGFGPAQTPSRVVLRVPGLTLKAYGEPSRPGPVLLLVPAPIKRAYIWDLAPGASVVEQCLRHGARPYLAQWEEPADAFGLADYGERLLLACAGAIRAETGEDRIFLASHSLGGLFAAVFAALHPERVAGLVLLATPLHFDFSPQAGALGPVMAELARSRLLDDAPGNVPGSFLSAASFLASPATFGAERLADWLRSWPDARALGNHLRVERWTLDEQPIARRLARELVAQLYGADAFVRGTLEFGQGKAAARDVVAPLLVVADRQCPIVPPQAVLPFTAVAGAADKSLVWYEGDTGVALRHLGPLIGAGALRELWPRILGWVNTKFVPRART